jgi:hypothetical protein
MAIAEHPSGGSFTFQVTASPTGSIFGLEVTLKGGSRAHISAESPPLLLTPENYLQRLTNFFTPLPDPYLIRPCKFIFIDAM